MDTRNSEQAPVTPPIAGRNALWMVPYARNPYFTGREAELLEIATTLNAGTNGTGGLAICGAGGIGKTQLALEYAHRSREEYRHVFWVLAESRDTLNAAYSNIAELLDLPSKGQQEQRLVNEAVTSWLANNSGWLLILDRLNDLALVRDFLPESFSGHLLLTTRASTTGKLARRIKLKKLDLEEGGRLLLRRAGILVGAEPLAEALPKEYPAIRAIVEELAGLPLALDLAGAYIAETASSLPAYLDLLRREPVKRVPKTGELLEGLPGPLGKTVRLAYEKTAKPNPAVADLLRFCAFLAPDEIPEALLSARAPVISKPMLKLAGNRSKWNAALEKLQKYGLIARDPEPQVVAIQREVQAALLAMHSEEAQKGWSERVVCAIGPVFRSLDVDDWEACQRLLPHARVCLALIDRWQLNKVEGAWMLHHAGWYLHTRGEYTAAQAYEERALAIYRAACGEEHPSTAMILNNLAVTYEDRGKLKEAANLHLQALAIRRSTLGENHPDTATSMSNLASNYHVQGKLEDAASLYRQALAIRRELLGDQHPDTAANLDSLALVYRDLGRFEDALALCQQALSIRRKLLGRKHPDTLATISDIATIYRDLGKFDEALSWLQQVLSIQRRTLGYEHAEIAATLNTLSTIYQEQGELDEAAFWLQQALSIQRGTLGHEQFDLARALEKLAIGYEKHEQPAKAEALYHQALTIYRAISGDDHPDSARCAYNLALLYQDQKRHGEARPLLERALAIWQTRNGPNHPDTKKARAKHEQLLQNINGTRATREEQPRDEQKPEGATRPRGFARVIRRGPRQ